MPTEPPDPAAIAMTRLALHGAAELLLAGPQHRTHGTIRLRIVPGGFATVYHEGSGAAPGEHVDADPAVAGYLADCFATGDAALRRLVPELTPVLWPEHFDVGVTVDEVNYGVSLGDSAVPEPYAYVGPWQPRAGEFWNVPFGAARLLRELGDTDGVAAFFAQGREYAARDPLAS